VLRSDDAAVTCERNSSRPLTSGMVDKGTPYGSSVYASRFRSYPETPPWAADLRNAVCERQEAVEVASGGEHTSSICRTAVLEAYGWNPALPDDQLLEELLELNLARAVTRFAPAP
jgi:hypothetical protein